MPSAHASNNWQYLGANGFTGAYTTTGGGGTPVTPHSQMDFLRMGVGRTPDAEYPDGYLGTIRSRRDDRGRPTDNVLDSLKSRQNQRAYQRGVHKGERIDPGQYVWPKELAPDRRLKAQAQPINNDGGMNYMVDREMPQEQLTASPQLLVNDGKANVSSNLPGSINFYRNSSLQHLRPRWA